MLCSLLQRLLTSPKDSFRDAGTSPSRTCRTASISSLAAYPPRSLANRLKRSVHTNTRRRKLSFITGTQASSTQQQWADKSLNVNNVLMDLNACDMWDMTTRMSLRKKRRTKSMKNKKKRNVSITVVSKQSLLQLAAYPTKKSTRCLTQFWEFPAHVCLDS